MERCGDRSSSTQSGVMAFFHEFPATWLPRIEAELQVCMTQAARELTIGAAGEYALMGPGKRLRPLLTLMAADSCGADPSSAMPAAMAIEMVHAFSLVHDDLPCMDDDDMRRGRPTTHKKFGEAMALLAGDALLASAFQKLSLLPPADAAKCMQELSFAVVMMIEGQALDIKGFQKPPTVEDLDHLNGLKTGMLIASALRMGAIAALASASELEALSTFGRALGLAFQITDDLLDDDDGQWTYSRLLGKEESRKRARTLIDDGVKALEGFGKKGENLRTLAAAVVERDH